VPSSRVSFSKSCTSPYPLCMQITILTLAGSSRTRSRPQPEFLHLGVAESFIAMASKASAHNSTTHRVFHKAGILTLLLAFLRQTIRSRRSTMDASSSSGHTFNVAQAKSNILRLLQLDDAASMMPPAVSTFYTQKLLREKWSNVLSTEILAALDLFLVAEPKRS
jgi:predicted acyltransferase